MVVRQSPGRLAVVTGGLSRELVQHSDSCLASINELEMHLLGIKNSDNTSCRNTLWVQLFCWAFLKK